MAKLNVNGLNPSVGAVREQLPANQAFVCRIINTKIEDNSYGQRLVFQLEIAEGEYKGYYMKDYKIQQGGQYEARYRGVFKINIPGPKSNHYDWDLNTFNRTLGAIEASNNGYKFADTMDTDTLKDKLVGIITREAEYNDNVYTEIGMMITAENARAGKFKPMERRGERAAAPATQKPAQAAPAASAFDDEDVPF